MISLSNRDENRIVFSHTPMYTVSEEKVLEFSLDTYRLDFIVQGRGKCVLEGREYCLTSGCVIITKPFEYRFVQIPDNASFDCYTVKFSIEDLSDSTVELLESIIGDRRGFCFTGKAYDAILSTFERSHSANLLPGQHADPYYRSLLAEIVCLLSIAREVHDVTDESSLGFRVIKYVNEYLTRDLTLEFLSKKFFVSKYYMCRAFKKHNGISVHGYMVHKRVMLAKQLIERGAAATAAAKTVGFRDYSAFYRAFIKIIGQSPLLIRTKGEV